ncbi:MAG: heat shock protein GrpE [Frankiales bacterium]|nr:heat shock protein GrpE [Frankiales bacterium]
MSETTEFDPDRVVVRDKRRLDPETGEVKVPTAPVAGETPSPAPAGEPEPAAAEAEATPDPVAELTDTLQRVQAEYANYRKRVERDRVAMVEQATGTLLAQLLPLLDDVERARQHDDLTGAFKTVGEGLEGVAARLGLEKYGAPGEPFDPQVHEAVMQAEPDPTFDVATCAQVFRPGFRVGGRVLRPAQVAVAEPGGDAPADTSTQL